MTVFQCAHGCARRIDWRFIGGVSFPVSSTVAIAAFALHVNTGWPPL